MERDREQNVRSEKQNQAEIERERKRETGFVETENQCFQTEHDERGDY